jgi:two-component system chemotaxis sensor kinase CheA
MAARELDSTVVEFLEECQQHLADIEADLLSLEEQADAPDPDLIAGVFRAAHSIKGGAGFLGFDAIKTLAHRIENVLGRVRDGELRPGEQVVGTLLAGFDRLQELVDDPAAGEHGDVAEHLQALDAYLEPPPAAEAEPPPAAKSGEGASGGAGKQGGVTFLGGGKTAGKTATSDPGDGPGGVTFLGTDTAGTARNRPAAGTAAAPAAPTGPAAPAPGDAAASPATPPATAPTAGPKPARRETSLRVSVELLDSLMTLAGELVLGRNQLLRAVSAGETVAVEKASQRLDHITTDLQDAIMQTRMQPVGNVFRRFPRLVRDLARTLGKQVDLQLAGEEVELDKTIVELIGDPLTHMVRNAVDHGLEKPAEREAAGKPARGEVVLRARHEAGQVVIEIGDDGRGLDGEKLAASAVGKGLLTADQAAAMSDAEKTAIIFMAGFSTAGAVSEVSGRGVGMDVVRANLDRLGGQVDVISTVGQGTTFSVKLPLTMAIMPSQLVRCGGERYAIPQANLEELLRIPAAEVATRLQTVGDAEVVRLRGELLPLVRLDRALGVGAPVGDGVLDTCHVAVVTSGNRRFGLAVDELLDSEEIVVKPLGRQLASCQGYAGATILGDGRVALILDVDDLAAAADLDEAARGAETAGESAGPPASPDGEPLSLLLFSCAKQERFAVPTCQVERVERVAARCVEERGGRPVMQYRGGTLPLISVDELPGIGARMPDHHALVIILSVEGREWGLLAGGPLETLEHSVAVDGETLRQPGIDGSLVLDGTVVQLVNVRELVQRRSAAAPDTTAPGRVPPAGGEADGEDAAGVILYAEDSRFFRDRIARELTAAGWTVLAAADGQQAWDLLQEHEERVQVVLTDIEMPVLDGHELARRIRADGRWADLPILALTTLAGEENEARGRAAGIDEYLIKLDHERLLGSLRQHLQRVPAVTT